MIVVVVNNLTKTDLLKAREDYREYIKITVDLQKKIVAIGGEYHADAEAKLTEEYQSKSSDIWGGGYNITLRKYETNAMINIKPAVNDSPDILDPVIREKFLNLVKEKLAGLELLM